jgi:serine/threonine protein kinase
MYGLTTGFTSLDERFLAQTSIEFPFEDISQATRNFEDVLGKGAYGSVSKGKLKCGTNIAVKILRNYNPRDMGGFKEEVFYLSKYRHTNIVCLLGFARNKFDRLLVYEFMENGDLAQHLHLYKSLSGKQRIQILYDACLAYSYLTSCKPPVFHRDVKTSNIMLDFNLRAKIVDFGLAVSGEMDKPYKRVTNPAGTVGYADPEYICSRVVTVNTEIFSFGNVIFECLTAIPPAIVENGSTVCMFFEAIQKGDQAFFAERGDPIADWSEQDAEEMFKLGLSCTGVKNKRPSFVKLLEELRSLLEGKRKTDESLAPMISTSVEDLVELGFSKENAENAWSQNKGDFESALDDLVNI